MLDRTFNAKIHAAVFVEPAGNKDNARQIKKVEAPCGGEGRENGLHPSCGPIAGLAALISRFIVWPFAADEK